jgi:Tol biopolymer transport system component
VTFENRQTSSPVWTPGGRALLFTQYLVPGKQGLWKITLSNPPRMEPLPISADNAFALAISPKGDRLVYTRQTTNSNIWAVDVHPGHALKDEPAIPKMLFGSSREDQGAAFSPDGRQIAFQSSRSGWNELWVADRDGSHARQMTALKGSIAAFPNWSPDGRRIAFHERFQGFGILFVLDLPTRRAQQLNYNAVGDVTPSWSHDGKWLYFASYRTGPPQVWKIAADGGGPMQLTKNGGRMPFESFDQTSIFFTKYNDGLWRIPVSGGEEKQVFEDIVAGGGLEYTPAPTGIYFIRRTRAGSQEDLAFFSFATGQIRSLAEIRRPTGYGLTVSPDDRTVLYTQIDHASSDLMLVENFR